jgi:succinyl-CoA synthetase beta subunit
MDLFEYQGKQLFAEFGIPVPRSWTVHPHGPDVGEIVMTLGLPLIVKAQVRSGGRGKAGGVRVARTRDEVAAAVRDIMGMTIGGQRVAAVLLEEAVEVAHEYYLAITIDRHYRRPLLMFSTKGGVDIEQVARDEPQAIWRRHIDPLEGLQEEQVRDLAVWAGLISGYEQEFRDLVRTLWLLFCNKDCMLLEINPLVQTAKGAFLALDSKVSVDGNALFRHPDIAEMREEEGEAARRAREAGIAYVALDGTIGVVGNGAGLVMSTLDLIDAAGGRPADFLDIGGGARAERITAALDIVLSEERVRALLVTVFGGITRCDEVARGLAVALGDAPPSVPIVVRLDGNGAAAGREIVERETPATVEAAATVWDAVQRVVALAADRGAPA